jgi:Tfp pilus assembly protein PilE
MTRRPLLITRERIRSRLESGYTLLGVVVATALVGLIGLFTMPDFRSHESNAHLSATFTTMQKIAYEAHLYQQAQGGYSTDGQGNLIRHPQTLPSNSTSAILAINTAMGTQLPTRNYFGGLYTIQHLASGRVAVRTTIPVSRFPRGLSSSFAAQITTNGVDYTIADYTAPWAA